MVVTTYGLELGTISDEHSGGLAKFDGTNWTVFYTTNSGLPDNYITSLAVDGSNIWIGTGRVDWQILMVPTGQFMIQLILACLKTLSISCNRW